jgi:threonyl-tRNA synthetase
MELEVLRHTTSHILSQALVRLFPKIKLAIGPAIKSGFYYDVDMEYKLSKSDFPKIEKEMKKIIKEKLPIVKSELTKNEALKFMKNKKQDYKVLLIEDIKDSKVSFYKQGEYVELCKGPHCSNTGDVNPKAFKILSVAGAYWRGNEENKMLQRIYGTVFEEEKDLKHYLSFLEESKKRDHRKIGKELELFLFTNEGIGFPFFLPNGIILRRKLEEFWRKMHIEAGYKEISTPIILNEDLWHNSGHFQHYKDNMYITKIDKQNFAIKPMNCPGAMLVYKHKPHSYKEFPLRYAELGLVHRHENSGNLHGLMRVRCFTQDDAHIFMCEDQVKKEIINIVNIIDKIYKNIGFKYYIEISTKPKDSMGSDEDWERAINTLKEALKEKNMDFTINEGDGAFYGPKIDFHLEDCLKRTWQCGTIQLDFQMPKRFNLSYVGKDGKKHQPCVVHRVVFGSIERFIGILTEHTFGNFPVWLSPTQVSVLTISEDQIDYATNVVEKLKSKGIRVEIDKTNNTFGKKIRDWIFKKVPYAVIIGEKELEENLIVVKSRDTKKQVKISLENFTENISKEINNYLHD